MTRIGSKNIAMLVLIFSVSGVAGAQGKHGDKGAPKDERSAPNPHADKPAPAPHAEKPSPAQHVQQQAQPQHVENRAQHAQRQAPPKRVEKAAQVQHAQQAAPAPRAQREAPVAHMQKPAPVPHVEQRASFVPAAEQQQRVRQEQHQAAQYRHRLDQDTRLAEQREAQLMKQNRKAQYRFQQQYYAHLAQQQQQLMAARDYSRDPYVSAPYSYRYVVSGNPRLTNQYGANVLRQAVDYGYEEGFQAGQADRQDGWAANYRSSYAYTDANYGYTGNYVNQSDYNYYFRQGFRRGYDDGYYGRNQYGQSLNGTYSILGTVLSGILGLTQLR